MQENSVQSVFKGSYTGAKSVEIVGAPSVLKAIRYGPGEDATARLQYFELYDGGTVNASAVISGGTKICNLYAGYTESDQTYLRAGITEPVVFQFPGLGIRFSTAMNISIPANLLLVDMMFIYQT